MEDFVKKMQALGKAERYALMMAIQTAEGGVISADELRAKFPGVSPGTLWAQLAVLVRAGLVLHTGAGRYSANPGELKTLISGVLELFGRKEWEPRILKNAEEMSG